MPGDPKVQQILESSFSSAPIGVMLLNKDARFVYLNPVFLDWVGRKKEEFIGKTVREVSPRFMDEETTELIAGRAAERVVTGARVTGAEIEMLGPHQKAIPISYSASGIRDGSGNIIGLVVFLTDNTEQKRHRRLRNRFIDQVLKAQEEERRRLARELHDETGSALTSIILGLRALDQAQTPSQMESRIRKLTEIAERTVQDVSLLARGLHPIALKQFGFAEALRQYVAEYGKVSGIDVTVHVGEVEESLDEHTAVALYRIMQEALSNVAKHSGASSASILLEKQGGEIRMVIEDDGRGLPEAGERDSGLSFGIGLHNIRERAALLGGGLEIESREGAGTALFVKVPVKKGP